MIQYKAGMRLHHLHLCWMPLFVAAITALASDADEKPDPVIDLGHRREIFVDRLIVGDLRGTTLKLHQPQLMPAISPRRPHGHYATVLRANDKFQFIIVAIPSRATIGNRGGSNITKAK